MGEVLLVALASAPLDVAAHQAAVSTPATGAVATFVGQVRDHSPDAAGEVVLLEYSAHPDATEVLTRLAHEAVAGHPDLRVAVSHRVGELRVGDPAIVVCAASSHRDLAFTVCRELVESVKAHLPVWKKQVVADGSHTWVGSA